MGIPRLGCPATFGYAMGLEADRRLVSVIGDGSFQLTAQEAANMIRHGQETVIFLVNNRRYVSESAIHDGPYNYFQPRHEAGLLSGRSPIAEPRSADPHLQSGGQPDVHAHLLTPFSVLAQPGEQFIGPLRRGYVASADIADELLADQVELAQHRVDRVDRIVRAPARASGSLRLHQMPSQVPRSSTWLRRAVRGPSYGSVTATTPPCWHIGGTRLRATGFARFRRLAGRTRLTWDGAQRVALAYAGFRRLSAVGPQPKCDLGYVE